MLSQFSEVKRSDLVRSCFLPLCDSFQVSVFSRAIGGFDGQRRLQTGERYCPIENQWSLINSMSTRRSDGHAVVYNDQIFMIGNKKRFSYHVDFWYVAVSGGFDGNDCLDTTESYNLRINRWTPAPTMNNRRSGVGATVCRDTM